MVEKNDFRGASKKFSRKNHIETYAILEGLKNVAIPGKVIK